MGKRARPGWEPLTSSTELLKGPPEVLPMARGPVGARKVRLPSARVSADTASVSFLQVTCNTGHVHARRGVWGSG
jgi:hypothetical protein